MRVDRVLAPNPGLFTGPGTNTYVVGDDSGTVVLDPGPRDDGHLAAIVGAIASRRVEAVLVTHTHPDHAPLANPLARDLGVPAVGYGPGPEFTPDEVLSEGEVVRAGGTDLVAIHTPGHADDHMCFLAGGVLFTGDHIMGGSSVMVDDVARYMESLERLQRLTLTKLYPGHGPEMDQPREVISWYIAHRREREAAILRAVRAGAGTIGAVVEAVYVDVDASLHPLAARSVAAHLRKLRSEGVVVVGGDEWTDRVEPIE
jgi:glyoxylase-like metal-dependent hydrolase (beta-lactamase superfamily II)